MPGPISQSYDGPRDGAPPFPPRRAYPHLSDYEYETLKREYHEKHRQEGVRDVQDERRPAG